MNIFIVVWSILFVIGVYDAREYRIPNYMVVILLVVSLLASLMTAQIVNDNSRLLNQTLGFIVTFFIGLLLYILKVMAAGDVKL